MFINLSCGTSSIRLTNNTLISIISALYIWPLKVQGVSPPSRAITSASYPAQPYIKLKIAKRRPIMPSQPRPLPKTFSPQTSEKSQGDETWSWCHRSDVAMPCSAKRSLAAIEGRGPELMTWETNAGPDSHHQWVNCARLGVSIHQHPPLIGPRHRNPPPEQWPPLKLGHHSNKMSWVCLWPEQPVGKSSGLNNWKLTSKPTVSDPLEIALHTLLRSSADLT